jgi:O-antigen/teichoic acid export membrane protein
VTNRAFYKATFLMGVTNLLVAVLNLVKQKIIAHFTGVVGMGVLGLVNSYLVLLYSLGSMTLFTAVTKFLSEYKANNDEKAVSNLWATVWTLSFGVSIAVSFLVSIFGLAYRSSLMGSSTSRFFFILLTWSLPIYSISNLLMAGMKGLKSFLMLAMVQVVATLTGVVGTFFLLKYYGINGVLWSLFLINSLFLVFSLLFIYMAPVKELKLTRFRLDYSLIRNLFKFSAVLMSTNLLLYGVQFLVRLKIVEIAGLGVNGIVQGALYFGMYFLIVQESINTYLFPRLSEIKDHHAINMELETAMRLVGLLGFSAAAGILVLFRPLIDILLTKDFRAIENILTFILLAEILRVWVWTTGSAFLAQSRLRPNFWITIGYVVLYGASILLLLPKYGALGFALGCLITSSVIFIANMACLYRLSGFLMSKSNILLSITGLALIGICIWLRDYGWGGMILGVLLVLLWCWIESRKEERALFIGKLKSIMGSR